MRSSYCRRHFPFYVCLHAWKSSILRFNSTRSTIKAFSPPVYSYLSDWLSCWRTVTGMRVMTRSPPSLSGSTISLRMLMSEYGQPKALGDRVRQTFNKRETQTQRNYNQANTNHHQLKQVSKHKHYRNMTPLYLVIGRYAVFWTSWRRDRTG